MVYTLQVCRYCRAKVKWDRRGRGYNDFGWYCSNHRSPEHPGGFHGYCVGDEVQQIEVVPADPVIRAVRDLDGAVRGVIPKQALEDLRATCQELPPRG
jgi:hypothetical protein